MKVLINIVTWTVIGAAGAFLAGLILGWVAAPRPETGGPPIDNPFILGAKASVQGALIGFFVGWVVPNPFRSEPTESKPTK